MLLDWVFSLNQFKQTRCCHSRYWSHYAMILRQTWGSMSIHIFSWTIGIPFMWESWILLLCSGWSPYGSLIGTLTSEVMICKWISYVSCWNTSLNVLKKCWLVLYETSLFLDVNNYGLIHGGFLISGIYCDKAKKVI